MTIHQNLCTLYGIIDESNIRNKNTAIELIQKIRKGLMDYMYCDPGNLYFIDSNAEQQTKFAQLEATIAFGNDSFWRCWMCIKLFKGKAPLLHLMINIGVKKNAESEYTVMIAGKDFDVAINNEASIASLYPEFVKLIETWLRTIDKDGRQEPIPQELVFCIYGK